MSVDLVNARHIIALEEQIREAARTIAKASLELNGMGYDITLESWDWKRSGSFTRLMPQGTLSVTLVEIKDRPKG